MTTLLGASPVHTSLPTPPPPYPQHRKPDTKDRILQGSEYVTSQEQAKHRGGKRGSAFQGLGRREEGETWPTGPGFPLG